jgi:hypothetical protein
VEGDPVIFCSKLVDEAEIIHGQRASFNYTTEPCTYSIQPLLLALSTKMSQMGHYETIRILGMCIGNVVHERNSLKMTSLTRFRMLELYFKNL